MKKLLSVILAALMLFSVVGMSASAAYTSSANQAIGSMANGNDYVIYFDFKSTGITTNMQIPLLTDTGAFEIVDVGYGENFYLVPNEANQQVYGKAIKLPSMKSSTSYYFQGWKCALTGKTFFAAPEDAVITSDMVQAGTKLVTLKPIVDLIEQEEDTMGTIMGVLVKVFGAIIGILFYNGRTEAGVELMQQVLGGLLG